MTPTDAPKRPTPTGRRPTGLSALPSPAARAAAFGGILVAGVLGAFIGFGVVDVQCQNGCTPWPGVGAILGALFFASGGAVLAVLVLRASGEWRAVDQDVPIGRRDDTPIRRRDDPS